MEFSEVLNKRRSHRSFLDKEPEKEKILKVLEAATKAPVSCNLQLTKYIVVQDKKIRQELIDQVSSKFSYAPCTIVVLVDNRYTVQRSSAVTGAGMAIENMILQAEDLGLGTCPMAGFSKDNKIKQILSIPDYYDINLLVAIGYPDVEVYKTDIPKVSSEEVYSFDKFERMTSINPSANLSHHSIQSVIDYRRRIAPVYLDRFRLNTWSDKFYKEVYKLVRDKFSEETRSRKIFDLMSYDGKFLQTVRSEGQEIVASDYLQHNLDFFKKKLSVETCLIDNQNNILTEQDSIELMTFIFQFQFTPKVENLLSNAFQKMKPGGYLIVATNNPPFYKSFAKEMIRNYKRTIKKEIYNIYENNPFYKIGPYKNISESNKKSILVKVGFQIKKELQSSRYPNIRIYLLQKP